MGNLNYIGDKMCNFCEEGECIKIASYGHCINCGKEICELCTSCENLYMHHNKDDCKQNKITIPAEGLLATIPYPVGIQFAQNMVIPQIYPVGINIYDLVKKGISPGILRDVDITNEETSYSLDILKENVKGIQKRDNMKIFK